MPTASDTLNVSDGVKTFGGQTSGLQDFSPLVDPLWSGTQVKNATVAEMSCGPNVHRPLRCVIYCVHAKLSDCKCGKIPITTLC